MEQDIFSQGEVMSGSFFKFENLGDETQGTYIAVKEGPGYMGVGTQLQYWIKSKDGIQIIGGKPSIDRQMADIRLGQIVGFRYVKDIPSKKGGKDFHQIDVYARPDIRDEEWLRTHRGDGLLDAVPEKTAIGIDEADLEEGLSEEESFPTEAEAKKAFDFSAPKAPSEEPFLTESEKQAILGEIAAIARLKLGALNPEEVKDKVMNATNLAFVENNLGKIVEAMRAL